MMLKWLQKLPHKKIFVAIYVFSFVVRILFFATHVPFSQDTVRDVTLLRTHIADQNYLIPYGPAVTVGNFNLPPFYYYIQLFAQLVFLNQFYAIDLLIIIIESATPVLLYYLVFKITKNRVASLGAAVLYCVAPAILQASNAWNPNLIPFFSLAFLISTLSYLIEKKNIWLLTGLLCFAVYMNLHFQWFVMAPIALVLVGAALVRIKDSWKVGLAGIAITALIFAPYFYYESSHNWQNSREAILFLTHRKNEVSERILKPAYVLFSFPNFYQRVMIKELASTTTWEDKYEHWRASDLVASAIFWSLFLSCVFIAWKKYKKDKNLYLPFYLASFVIMMVTLRMYNGDKPDYYLWGFLNFIFALIAIVVDHLTKKRALWMQVLPFVLIGAVEIFVVLRIAPFNDYAAYQKITDKINELAQNNQVLVQPVNNELEKPIRYFVNEPLFHTDIDEVNYYVLFCYVGQNCDRYQPNQKSSGNEFNYRADQRTNYSHTWSSYNSQASFVISASAYTAFFIKTK